MILLTSVIYLMLLKSGFSLAHHFPSQVYLLQRYYKEELFLLLLPFLFFLSFWQVNLWSLLYSVDFSYVVYFDAPIIPDLASEKLLQAQCLSPADKALSSLQHFLTFWQEKEGFHAHPELSQDQPWTWPFL